jgi:hypothetical protein
MSLVYQFALVSLLVLFIGIWWLAVRICGGARLGALEWLPVALAVFGVPIMIADVCAIQRDQTLCHLLIAAWFGAAVMIDAVWLFRRWRRTRKVHRTLLPHRG